MAESILRIVRDDQKALPQRFAFTVKRLERMRVPPGKRYVMVYDTKAPRLAYVLTANGSKSFYFYGRMKGRPRRYRIGDGSISIDRARQAARDVLADVGRGIDLSAERRKARAATTFGAAFIWFIEKHAKPKKRRTWEEMQQRHDQYLKSLDGYRIDEITTGMLRDIHNRISLKHPRVANRVLALVSSVYGRLQREDGNEDLRNPASKVERNEEIKRERSLQASELPRFFKALDKLSDDMADFFRLTLFTGARSGNVRQLEWDEISLADGVCMIPAAKMKAKRPVILPLADAAIDVLRRMQAAQGKRERYVFPAESKAGYLSEPKTLGSGCANWRT